MRTLRLLVRHPTGRLGLVLLALLVLAAVFAPVLAPYDPLIQNHGDELVPPLRTMTYPLGTDELGRDMASRLLWATRTAFLVGAIAVSAGVTTGVLCGLLAGYFGGWVDSVIMRLFDVLITFPNLLLAIAIVSAVGPGQLNVAYSLAVALVPGTARLLRGQVLAQRERDYVLAAQAIGAQDARIMFRHILPNSIAPLVVTVFLALGFSVLADAGLSFLGLGTQPPHPSWGAMLNASRAYLRDAWWYGFGAMACLATFMLALNSISDALRDVLDPRHLGR